MKNLNEQLMNPWYWEKALWQYSSDIYLEGKATFSSHFLNGILEEVFAEIHEKCQSRVRHS